MKDLNGTQEISEHLLNDLSARVFALETLVFSLVAHANERDPRLIPHLNAVVVDVAMAVATDNPILKAARVYTRQLLDAAAHAGSASEPPAGVTFS